MSRVDVSGIGIAYDDVGAGPPVVLVHGLGGGRWSWDANVAALAARHRVIAPDLPGHGQSDKPAIDYRMPTLAATLAGLLDALRIDRAALVGNSMGGLIALEAAIASPDRVSKLVLANAAGATRFPIERLPVDPRRFVGLPITIRPPEKIVEKYIRFLFVAEAGWPIDHSLAKTRETLARDDYPAQANAFLRSAIGTFDSEASKHLDAVHCPTLVVWGDADRLLPKESPDVFAKIPGARLERLPNVGHVPQMEAPDRFNALLTSFLAER